MAVENYILIGEDDPDDRFLLQSAFEDVAGGCNLRFVENGVDLLNFLKAEAVKSSSIYPSFILLDLNMPRKDGREVLAELKTTPHFENIPVIIFSTTSNEREMKRCYELGANSYITKPNSFELLRDTMQALCNYWIQVEEAPATPQG